MMMIDVTFRHGRGQELDLYRSEQADAGTPRRKSAHRLHEGLKARRARGLTREVVLQRLEVGGGGSCVGIDGAPYAELGAVRPMLQEGAVEQPGREEDPAPRRNTMPLQITLRTGPARGKYDGVGLALILYAGHPPSF